jgi:HK97 family phage prohead protease
MSMIERRISTGGGAKLSSDFDETRGQSSRMLTGYASVFNQLSENLGGFREKVQPGAFSRTIKAGDIRLLLNHEGLPLARTTARNLRLSEDGHGLRFEADVDESDPDFARIIPKIRSKTLSQMSIGFVCVSDTWDHSRPSIRTVLEAELLEISVVTFPAYPQTSIGVRNPAQVYSDYQASGRGAGQATPTSEQERLRLAADARRRLALLEMEKKLWGYKT